MSASGTPNVVVVTRVQRPVLRVFPPPPPSPGTTVPLEDNYTFNRGTPLVIGAIQIVFALIILVLCVMLFASHADRLAVSTGVFVWGPLMFIIAGCLTVAAGASLEETLVKTAVRFNSVAALTAAAATIIFFVDTINGMKIGDDPFGHDEKDRGFLPYTGFSIPMSFLEFGLSLQVALSSCRGSCAPQAYTITNQLYRTDPVAVETPPTYQAPISASAPPPPYEKPPDYSSLMS